jgi:hypothetical protein
VNRNEIDLFTAQLIAELHKDLILSPPHWLATINTGGNTTFKCLKDRLCAFVGKDPSEATYTTGMRMQIRWEQLKKRKGNFQNILNGGS